MVSWVERIFSSAADEIVMAHDWYGASAATVRFKTVQDPENIILGGIVELPPIKVYEPDFQEGLWEGEVLEFFLECDNRSYLEVNIAPGAAHWVCAFSGYRQRKDVFKKTIFQLFGGVGVGSWRASIMIPRSILPGSLSKIHYAAILGDASKQYLSSHVISGTKPDFHGFAKEA